MTIHGSGKPKLILDYGGANERTIILPYCDSLVESFEPEIYQVRLYSGTLETRIIGWWYSAELNFSKHLSLTDLQSLHNGTAKLFSTTSRGTIRLYPYSSSVYYAVELDAEQALAIMHRPFNEGHSGIKLKFNGTSRISTIDLTTTT